MQSEEEEEEELTSKHAIQMNKEINHLIIPTTVLVYQQLAIAVLLTELRCSCCFIESYYFIFVEITMDTLFAT